MAKTRLVSKLPRPSKIQSSRPSSRQSSSRAPSPASSPTSETPSVTATVQVVVRLRPINEREKKHGTLPVVTASSHDKTVTVVKGSGQRQVRSSYTFDNVFSAFTSQEEIFEVTLRPVLIDVMQGFESTVFAYGQTGTGKTHTMEGDLSSPELHGVIPRSAESIFMTLNQPDYDSHTITCSYLEIYNEELCDLFADEEYRKHTKVEIMEGKDGICCRGQTEKEVYSAEDVLSLMRQAQQFRKIGETKMNKHSSRSHCIFTIKVNAKRVLLDGSTLEVHGKLHLVDLAGSECAKTASGRGTEVKRDRERSNINKSLLTLGRVIIMLKELSEKNKGANVRIPYRDSKLTRLLQKSLGGKCKTLVIATLSPSISSIEESVSTLNYAQSANGIVNKPVATSYLSINSNTTAINTAPSGESSADGQTLEHWYEMECRLQYMQTQVEEAQAALARNYTVHQELIGKAEKAEQLLGEMEHKYEDAKKEIKDLKKDVAEEKKKKNDIALVLKQTEMELKNTTLILEATQNTESSLTAEATALIKTVQDSISDGDQLHQNLLDAREIDAQRRLATTKFHSITVTVLEHIMSTLSNLSKKEEEYCNTTIDSAEKGNKISHHSLDQSLEVMKEVTTNVSALTSTIKSHVQDEEGIIPLISKISIDVKSGVDQSTNFLMNGEGELRASFQTGHKQLKEYSNKLKLMDSDYVISTEHLLTSLDNNFSQSKDKVLNMVASITGALSSVRDANSKTRNALDIIISKLDKDSIEAATSIEDLSKNQNTIMASGIDSFTDGMQHVRNIRIKLKEHANFIETDGSSHLNDIKTQNSMLSYQQDLIIKAEKEQKVMKDEFLTTVLNGVTSLVNDQISLLSKKQIENLKSFANSNKGLLEKNIVICASADNILGEVEGVNQKMLEHVEHVDKNDSDMKVIAENAKTAFVSVLDTSKRQQHTIKTHVNTANSHLTKLAVQDETVGNISSKMQIERNIIVERVQKLIQDEKKEVTILSDTAKQQSDYTSNVVIASVLENLVTMEKPRKELIASISNKLDSVVNAVKEGKDQLDTITQEQCSVADKLQREVETKHLEHNNTFAKNCRDDFDACKKSIVDKGRGHLKVSTTGLSSSTLHASSAKFNIDDFVTNTIQYNKSIPHVRERKSFGYSLKLSATPSSDSIVKGLQ